MKKSTIVATAIALLCTATPSFAQTAPAENAQTEPYRLRLGEWAKLNHQDRVIVVLGAIEGLLLAAQAPDTNKAPVNDQCLVSDSPIGIEQKLLKLKERYKKEAFVDVFLVATNCLEAA